MNKDLTDPTQERREGEIEEGGEGEQPTYRGYHGYERRGQTREPRVISPQVVHKEQGEGKHDDEEHHRIGEAAAGEGREEGRKGGYERV